MTTDAIQQNQRFDTAKVAAHYDDLDRFYREIWGEHVHHGLFDAPGMSAEEATRRLIEVVADEARVAPGHAVCDVGCGYGGTSRALCREYGASVTGLTISSAQYDYATGLETDGNGPTFHLRDWLDNGLPPSSFDAVIAVESTEHMADLAGFFAEASRVLRPGGRLVICAWLARANLNGWERRHLIGPICEEGRLRGMETEEEYHALAAVSGLKRVASNDVSRYVKRTWSICIKRVAAALLRSAENRRFLLRDGGPNRVFAGTLARIRLAYELGAMRYGILTYRLD